MAIETGVDVCMAVVFLHGVQINILNTTINKIAPNDNPEPNIYKDASLLIRHSEDSIHEQQPPISIKIVDTKPIELR